MKIKTLLIPVLGFSIVGVLMLKQDIVDQNNFAQNLAEETTGNYLVSKQTNTITAKTQRVSVLESLKQVQQLPAEVLVEHIQIQPTDFDQLTQGKKLSIYIPQEQQDYSGTIEKSHQQFGGQVQVASGSIDDGQPFSSFTVTKGPELTLVMIATGEKVYQVEINNKTGAGTVIDDQSLDYFRKHDDGQATPPEGIS